MKAWIAAFSVSAFLSAQLVAEDLRIFIVEVREIHPVGIECRSVWDWNRQKDVAGKHFIRMKTENYDLYHGQELKVYVRKDGTITSDDKSLTLRAWKLDPNYEVKLID